MSIEEVGDPATGHELITQALGPDGLRIKGGDEAIATVLQSENPRLQLFQQADLVNENERLPERLGIIISGTNGQPLFELFQYSPADIEVTFKVNDEYITLTNLDHDEEIFNVLTVFYTFANLAADDLSSDLLHGMVRVMALAANYNGNLPKDKWPAEFAQLVLDAE